MKFLILNGPNVNLQRYSEPGMPGELDYNGMMDYVQSGCDQMGIETDVCQTNHEGDLIADLQAVAHGGVLLLLLLLRTVDHEVQQDQHQCQREEQADVALGRGGQKLHGAKSPLKIQIKLLYLFKRPVSRFILKFGCPEASHICRGRP